MALDWAISYRRTQFEPLDISYVFDSVAQLEDYLSGDPFFATPFDPANIKGVPYAGQVTAVLNGANQPDVCVIWEVPSGTAGAIENQLNNLFYSYALIGGGGGGAMPEPPDDGALYGRTRAASTLTGTWELVADDGTY